MFLPGRASPENRLCLPLAALSGVSQLTGKGQRENQWKVVKSDILINIKGMNQYLIKNNFCTSRAPTFPQVANAAADYAYESMPNKNLIHYIYKNVGKG